MAFHSPVLRPAPVADLRAADSGALQPLHWAELRARLVAGQQLRQALVTAEPAGHSASFAPGAARALAEARRAVPSGAGGGEPS